MRGRASTFHARAWPEPVDGPVVWVFEVTQPALVLGSTQPDAVVDQARAEAAGVEVVRRQSGGGAVLLRPGEVVWVDVLVPAGDVLWEPDVARAFHWLGQTWVEALGQVGVATRWRDGPMVTTAWSSLVCFAGLGPGEVTTVDGGKVVGISQRRRRAGALFQCAAVLAWDPAALLDLLRLPAGARGRAAVDLQRAACGLRVAGHDLEDAFVGRLARG